MTTDYYLLWPFLVISCDVHVYVSIMPLQMGLILYSFYLFSIILHVNVGVG